LYTAVLWHTCLRRWWLNGSVELTLYVPTDAVWLLFIRLVQMFCTSKFNILVLQTPPKLTNKILYNSHIFIFTHVAKAEPKFTSFHTQVFQNILNQIKSYTARLDVL
jgi:hypothetical protein